MPKLPKKNKDLPKVNEINMTKISVLFKKSILKSILKILVMEHGGFRTFKSVKNINRLFSNLDMDKYKSNPELEAYVWCIAFISKKWLDGIVSPELIFEMMKSDPNFTNVTGDIVTQCMEDENLVTPPEAKAIFDLISEYLQLGFIDVLKDEYIELLEDIDMSKPGAHYQLLERLFKISQSVIDIRYNTNTVTNKIEFSTADVDSVKSAVANTVKALSSDGYVLKTGIRRLNTLLSPGYMPGRLYVYAGLPGSYKSGILLQSVLDIRKFNPGYVTRTPGMKPCCLYITMENTFMETIERMWMMIFDEPITNYSENEAVEMLCGELGIGRVLDDARVVADNIEAHEIGENGERINSLEAELLDRMPSNECNIEIVVQYYPYRSINTDDLYTIINDLRDENLEVCALVFDYIKRIEPANPVKDNERLELDHIVNELKAIAVLDRIPIVTAHQLNRLGATAIDSAEKAGKHDLIKEVNRDNIGGAWSVAEVADFLAFVGTEYKSGTDEKYFTIKVAKRRRIDASEAEFAKFTYLAHPFSTKNPFRLLPDMNTDKVLSVQSLATDIPELSTNKTNAVPRLQKLKASDFNEDY